ncbi:reverse transcriptase domain-containing protein, partial [Tanacetum coccineum]
MQVVRSCSDVVAFASCVLKFAALRHLCIGSLICCVELSVSGSICPIYSSAGALCGLCHIGVRLLEQWVCSIVNAPAGRLLGAYNLGVATPRAVVHADDKTSGDASRLATASRGWGTSRRAGRSGGRTRGRSSDEGDGRIYSQGGQLRNLLPTIVTQVGDQGRGQGNGRNQNGDAINDNIRGDVRNAIQNNDSRGYTYKEFLAYNPKEYDGRGDAVVYTRWIEKMESVQDMSGYGDNQKVKYTAGSFVGKALTWWNSQIHTLGREVVVGTSWDNFKVLIREDFCPTNEMQKLETELWNHAMVGADHAAYIDMSRELARLVPHLVTLENRRIERCVYGLALNIRGMVAATEPSTIQKAVQIAGTLTGEDLRNRSIKKNPEKRGNVG